MDRPTLGWGGWTDPDTMVGKMDRPRHTRVGGWTDPNTRVGGWTDPDTLGWGG